MATDMSVARDMVLLPTCSQPLVRLLLHLALWKPCPGSRFEALLLMRYVTKIRFAVPFITRIRYRPPFDSLMIAIVAMSVAHWAWPGRRWRAGRLARS